MGIIVSRVRMRASDGIIPAMRVRTGITARPVAVVPGRIMDIASVMGVSPLGQSLVRGGLGRVKGRPPQTEDNRQ
jgi:hypothetical protein